MAQKFCPDKTLAAHLSFRSTSRDSPRSWNSAFSSLSVPCDLRSPSLTAWHVTLTVTQLAPPPAPPHGGPKRHFLRQLLPSAYFSVWCCFSARKRPEVPFLRENLPMCGALPPSPRPAARGSSPRLWPTAMTRSRHDPSVLNGITSHSHLSLPSPHRICSVSGSQLHLSVPLFVGPAGITALRASSVQVAVTGQTSFTFTPAASGARPHSAPGVWHVEPWNALELTTGPMVGSRPPLWEPHFPLPLGFLSFLWPSPWVASCLLCCLRSLASSEPVCHSQGPRFWNHLEGGESVLTSNAAVTCDFSTIQKLCTFGNSHF